MNDHFVPEGIDWSAGVWMAVTNDPFLINFLHRWWAWATALALLLLARALWRRGGQGEAAGLALGVAGQVAPGLATVSSEKRRVGKECVMSFGSDGSHISLKIKH